jgi:hypothetical protein
MIFFIFNEIKFKNKSSRKLLYIDSFFFFSHGTRVLNSGLCVCKAGTCWAPVAHACDPRYWRGWDQEDWGLRPVQANSSKDPISKITTAKWTVGVTQTVECLLWKHKTLSSNPSPTACFCVGWRRDWGLNSVLCACTWATPLVQYWLHFEIIL